MTLSEDMLAHLGAAPGDQLDALLQPDGSVLLSTIKRQRRKAPAASTHPE